MYKKVVEKLINSGLTIATAESCTGGMIAQLITAVEGASQCLGLGVVTYSNQSKIELLGVSSSTIEKYGAVSRQTAMEMSRAIREKARADIGVGVTGIAGPGGGSVEKPIGLVYISICTTHEHICREMNFVGSREDIRAQTTEKAFELISEIC
ncbi:MAG: CinA family protein [Clostridiales bacterium]|jgi:PncC family amidohydrolase|nr:CinA family protein [Clostridiales bacterium]